MNDKRVASLPVMISDSSSYVRYAESSSHLDKRLTQCTFVNYTNKTQFIFGFGVAL